MFLSHLLIDLGENPDRPRPGRLWLRNRYRVHQRLSMAFPSFERKTNDPHFLQPYNPADFQDVRVSRSTDGGFLFRVDPLPSARAAIIVQSAHEPDWDYAFHNAQYFLAAPPQVKAFDPRFEAGQRFRFRLLAYPVKRVSKNSTGESDETVGRKWADVPVPASELRQWLVRRTDSDWTDLKRTNGKDTPPGFRLSEDPDVQPGYVYVDDNGKLKEARRRRSALYNGVLEITNPDCFLRTLESGIGRAKAFGFGLLSVAPIRD